MHNKSPRLNKLKNIPKQKKRKSRKWIYFSGSIFFVLFLIVALLFIMAEEPPVHEIEKAKKALVQAGALHAEKYSPQLVSQAKEYYDLAISSWTAQNQEWFFQRDFSGIKNFANLSEEAANKAIAEANSHETNLTESLAKDLKILKDKAKKSQFLFKTFPFNKELKNKFTKGDMLLTEADMDYSKGDLLSCKTKLSKAITMVNESVNSAINILKNDFRNYDTWVEQKDKTINISKQNGSYAFVVDKYNRKCYVYKSGKLVKNYSVELGPDWFGTKKQSGDDKTPEGMYKITKKKSGGHTRYYKALLLDYPNEKDKINFKNSQKNGILSKRAKIGGLIEIHGDGGKGFDWTNGCIALTNGDMDRLYNFASVGMPVTIVGSLTSLNEIISGL